MSGPSRIAVGMSGGVDSSTAAALLVEQGHEVFGIMMRLWSEDADSPNRCCSPHDMAQARRIAGQLDIPFYVLDVQTPFKRQVVDFFVQGYRDGFTPNPCMECNRVIRWTHLLNHAVSLGATHLATGHYARITSDHGRLLLQRARDRVKDQSYVLSVLTQEQLHRAVFPLGEYTKSEVRDHARRLHLPVADRRESQDLCFVGRAGYRPFLARHAPDARTPGEIVDMAGHVIGAHTGLADYTIGQRKGIGVAGPRPLYVIGKDAAQNRLIVGSREVLGRSEFDAGRVNWIDGTGPAGSLACLVRVRYKAREVEGTVLPQAGGRIHVNLVESLPDVTPGQAAVFYDGETCLGGGTILS
jgi:tRNA-specific 2-thiouridylase